MGDEALSDAWWSAFQRPLVLGALLTRVSDASAAVYVRPLEPGADTRALVGWLRDGARDIGFEGDIEHVSGGDVRESLRRAGPYIILRRLHTTGEWAALALIKTRSNRCLVVHPDGRERTVGQRLVTDEIERALLESSPWARILRKLEIDPGRLLRGEFDAGGGSEVMVVHYQLDGAQPVVRQLLARGLVSTSVRLLALSALQTSITLVAAFTLGSALVDGAIDVARIIGWALLAASLVPVQYLMVLGVGELSLEFATVVKKRLMEGALRIPQEHLRVRGAGNQTARLNEASTVEQLNVSQVLQVLSPLGQLCGGLVLLGSGALPVAFSALWLVFAIAAGVLGIGFFRGYRQCYEYRSKLTQDLVEKTVGHRTRAVQSDVTEWHTAEDRLLHEYGTALGRLHRMAAGTELYGRAWFTLCLGLISATFIVGDATPLLFSTAVGTYLCSLGFSGVMTSLRHGAALWCAWSGVRHLFHAGRAHERHVPTVAEASSTTTLASAVSFAYRARDVLKDVHLRVEQGDRILITGPSGGGKSTLAKLFTGELKPTHGSILVNGIDRKSVSEATWRRQVASSPQFHENHVFSHTFAFNLDPRGPEGELTSDARAVCFELGLKDLLGRMPSRAAQVLGETGWQLSHGERSRVFIARSLLQGAQVVILDESLAALDPETLAATLRCVRKRAATLFAIAHR